MEYVVIGKLDDRTERRDGVRASQVPLIVEDLKRMGADVTVCVDGVDVLTAEGEQ